MTWAVIMIVIASILGLLMALTRRDAAYLFVLVWSFIGIAVKQTPAPSVVTTAWIAAAVMFILAIYSIWRQRTA
jgi:hypothetical protein